MNIELPEKEDWKESGLSRDHWHELNKSGAIFPVPERYDELRELYKDIPRALLAIDQFDPESEWKRRFNEAKGRALKSRSTKEIDEFHKWEKENYPGAFK